MSIRRILPATLFLLLTLPVLVAQNTNSTYSRYGYGNLETPAMGKTRAMGGLGFGIHERGLIDVLNPASYADVDTMNMLFDFGLSAQFTAFKENGVSQFNPNGYLDHVGMKFALKPKWGVAFGLIPFSKVGYQFTVPDQVTPLGDVEYSTTYSGAGGLNTFFLGTGFSVAKGLSAGVNLKYTFGLLSNTTLIDYTSSDYNNEQDIQYVFVKAPSLDLGLQYDLPLTSKSILTLGAAASAALPVKSEWYNVNIASDTLETTKFYKNQLPTTLGLGLSYNWDDRLTVGLDYQNQRFSQARFMGAQDSLRDNNRISLGVEYLPSTLAEHYYQAIHYRGGLQFNDMYLKYVKDQPAHLRSASLSLGVGLPLRGQKSMLHFAFEAGRLFTPDASFISETYYKVSIDVSFNELWFFKMKL
jgi:opacity protein-like surface antigen